MKRKRTWIVPVVWLAVLTCILLCLGGGAAGGPGQGSSPGHHRLANAREPGEAAVIGRHLKVDSQMVDFSQYIREHVDFLLTPALLVQEAISEARRQYYRVPLPVRQTEYLSFLLAALLETAEALKEGRE